MTTTLVLLIILALSFDFINGFHDAANSVATLVGTGVFKLWQALIWAATFNFIAFFVFPLHVAMTIGGGILEPQFIHNPSIAAALSGAIVFNLGTWLLGLPSSSSHALIGGLIGVGLMQGGIVSVHWPIIGVIILFAFIAPFVGMGVAYVLMKIIPRVVPEGSTKRFYPVLQLLSSALLSLGHGGNDAQKTMGIIVALLFANGQLGSMDVTPLWVVLGCYSVISLGTICGGWRIINTIAYKITKLKVPTGTCAELGAAFVLFIANHLGIPLSTTHVLTGGVFGVSSYNPETFAHTNWAIIKRIIFAWILTLPVAAFFSASIYMILS